MQSVGGDALITEASTLKVTLGVSAWSSAYWLGQACPLVVNLTILSIGYGFILGTSLIGTNSMEQRRKKIQISNFMAAHFIPWVSGSLLEE